MAFTNLVIAIALVLYGFAALRAAEASASRLGGLLGGFGFIPIILGVALAMLSIPTLVLTRRRRP